MRLKQHSDLAEAPPGPILASAASSAKPETEPLALVRVVIADDNAAIRTLARYALSPHRGFHIVGEAADGSEALALIETHRPDCVVLDIEMPGMGGFEALAELRRRSPGVPVILLSGHSDAGVAERAVDGGAAALLDKTSEFHVLADTIRRVTSPAETVEAAQVEPSSAVRHYEPKAEVDAITAELRRLEYVVSHDLGEPLRIMSGFAALLESRYGAVLDASGQTFVTHIADASRRMQGMLADLLTYARAGQQQPVEDDVDLATLVPPLRQELADRILERGAEVTAGELPSVLGDPDMLKTVLGHLVVNAITFNTSTHPQVHITGRLEGDSAVVTVTDNGIGIAPAQRERVFDLFQRLNTRDEYPGTGTGLALCRRLVTLQHGTLELDAAPAAGTIVTLTMPASPARGQQATPTHRRPA